MQYSKLNKLNIEISKLGLGAMRFPKNGEIIDQDQVNEMVRVANEGGINYFDTAYVYDDGGSEKALGKALKQLKREDFYVTDQMPFWLVKKPEDIDRIWNETLENIGVEYIDFYLMHALDRKNFDDMMKFKGIEWAIEKKKQGFIKYLGFSIHDDVELLNEVLDLYDWDFVQIQYNYMDIDDNPGHKGYEELVKRNIPIIIMEPLKGGMLANVPKGIGDPYMKLGDKSPASYSFRWLGEKEGIATILSGMSNLEQLRENINIFNSLEPLKEEEHKAIEKVKNNINNLQKVKCTGCNYCMPCPKGVKIPGNFKAWNTKSMNMSENWISGTSIDYENASKCVGCGICASHCPQKIDIPNKIKEMISEK